MSNPGYSFHLSKWDKHQSDIYNIRDSVFVQEIGLSQEKIQNQQDSESYHVLAYDGDGQLIGAGTMYPNGEIGHVAVLKPWRRRTVGKAILIFLLQIAERLHLPSVWVDAIDGTSAFYRSKQFQLTDRSSSVDGYNFQRMVKTLESKVMLH